MPLEKSLNNTENDKAPQYSMASSLEKVEV